MSFADNAILWLHIGAAIFTIGPVTAAIHSTPRYIRRRDAAVVGFLLRITRIYGIASLLVFVLGMALAGQNDEFSKPWVSISMTLFVVALVLMAVIIRDQGKAVEALKRAAVSVPAGTAVVPAGTPAVPSVPAGTAQPGEGAADARDSKDDDAKPDAKPAKEADPGPRPAAAVSEAERVADVERGRIAAMGGITSLIWLVILILMVWQ